MPTCSPASRSQLLHTPQLVGSPGPHTSTRPRLTGGERAPRPPTAPTTRPQTAALGAAPAPPEARSSQGPAHRLGVSSRESAAAQRLCKRPECHGERARPSRPEGAVLPDLRRRRRAAWRRGKTLTERGQRNTNTHQSQPSPSQAAGQLSVFQSRTVTGPVAGLTALSACSRQMCTTAGLSNVTWSSSWGPNLAVVYGRA